MTFLQYNKSDMDSFIKTKTCVGWLENKHIKNRTALTLMQNITEHMVMETYINDIPQQYGSNIESLLSSIFDKGYQFAIVIKIGNEVTGLFGHLQKYFSEHYQGEKVIGHVLDRGDQYYEIHPQFFIIDVQWWDSVGRPRFECWDASADFVEPVRSEENFHDEYTPVWIKSGTDIRTYNNLKRGAHWINLALQDGGVGIIPKHLRNVKTYFYPEVQEDYIRNTKEIYNQLQTDVFFATNTETIDTKSINHENIDIIACSAGALSAWVHAFTYKIKPMGGLIYIFDVSALALQIQHDLYNTWDGKDYASWLRNWFDRHPYLRNRLVAAHRLDEYSNWIDSIEGFHKWWKQVVRNGNLTVDIVNKNLLRPREITKHLRGYMRPGYTVMLHTSNIFMYHKTSWILEYNDRWQLWRELKDSVEEWKNTDDMTIIDKVMFNDHNRQIMEILPWYQKF